MVTAGEQRPSVGIVGSLAHWGPSVACRGSPTDETFFAGTDVGRRTLLGEPYPFWSPSCLLHRTTTDHGTTRVLQRDCGSCGRPGELRNPRQLGLRSRSRAVDGHSRPSRIENEHLWRTQRKWQRATNLDLLITYGPKFLDHDELATRIERYLAYYYRELARSECRCRGGPSHVSVSPPPRPIPPLTASATPPSAWQYARTIARRWRVRQGRREVGEVRPGPPILRVGRQTGTAVPGAGPDRVRGVRRRRRAAPAAVGRRGRAPRGASAPRGAPSTRRG